MTIYVSFTEDGDMRHVSDPKSGFWDDQLFSPLEDGSRNPTIPEDAIAINQTEYDKFFKADGPMRFNLITGRFNKVSLSPPSDEHLWFILRNERDRRLAESDEYVLADRWASMNIDTQSAWALYRQALRDLPNVTEDPTNPNWPEKPA